MSARVSHAEERQAYAEFATHYGEEDYRARLADLYAAWRDFNAQFFQGRLLEPHLALGRTAARSLGHCARTTDYGGSVQITLNAGLVFGTNSDWVVRPWPPADGTRRFVADLLLRFGVRQFVAEALGTEEPGYRGFGPKFIEEANRIGGHLGLAPVVAYQRGSAGRQPLARGWPHCVRPAGYYGGDVTVRALDLAGGGGGGGGDTPAGPLQGVCELLQYLLIAGRTDDARQLLARHLEWLCACSASRWPVRRAVETGDQDVDGSPLGLVQCGPEWLTWNGGTVRRLAEGIHEFGSLADLPLLAAALDEAGCRDGRILRHLREKMEHTRRCWVLRLLIAPGAA